MDEFQYFSTAGEAQALVKFSSLVEEEDLLGLFGKIFFGFCQESEVGIAVEDVFEVGDEVWFGLNKFGSWAFLFLAFSLEFLGGFGYEK